MGYTMKAIVEDARFVSAQLLAGSIKRLASFVMSSCLVCALAFISIMNSALYAAQRLTHKTSRVAFLFLAQSRVVCERILSVDPVLE